MTLNEEGEHPVFEFDSQGAPTLGSAYRLSILGTLAKWKARSSSGLATVPLAMSPVFWHQVTDCSDPDPNECDYELGHNSSDGIEEVVHLSGPTDMVVGWYDPYINITNPGIFVDPEWKLVGPTDALGRAYDSLDNPDVPSFWGGVLLAQTLIHDQGMDWIPVAGVCVSDI